MAEVPAWLLVLNTLAAGGFGLAGSFLVPRSEREKRREERRLADAAIMREKAVELFGAVQAVRARMVEVAQDCRGVLGDRDDGLIDARALTLLTPLWPNVATFFPAAVPILEEGEAAIQQAAQPFREQLADLDDGPQTAEGRQLRIQLILACIAAAGPTTHRLQRHLIEAIKRYSPVGPA